MHKTNRREKITKLRAEINEMRSQQEQDPQTRVGSLKFSKNDKLLATIIKRNLEKPQCGRIRTNVGKYSRYH